MSGDDIAVACVLGPVFTGLGAFVVHILMEGLEDKLWPRGLRWFPGLWLDTTERLHRLALCIFWPEKLPRFKGRVILRLEALDQSWRCWNSMSTGEPPRWVPSKEQSGRGRWEPYSPDKHGEGACPCGYMTECALWCGSGHADGGCPTHNPEPTALSPGVRYDAP